MYYCTEPKNCQMLKDCHPKLIFLLQMWGKPEKNYENILIIFYILSV